MLPPDYYLCYGYKYAMRFTNELFPELSPRGKTWLITARLNLQLAIEQRLLRDPEEFAALERSPDDFRDFCFGSHAVAYLDAGLANLPLGDLALIGTTPDIGDLFTTAGMAQVVEVAFGIAGRQEAGVFGGAALVNGSWPVRRRLQEATKGKAQR